MKQTSSCFAFNADCTREQSGFTKFLLTQHLLNQTFCKGSLVILHLVVGDIRRQYILGVFTAVIGSLRTDGHTGSEDG